MDANKKIDLTNPQCPNESKILRDILNHHPLQFSLATFASVPWIYIQQFWHSLKLDDLKDKFMFFLDAKAFKFLVDDFRCVFQFPQATKNNNVAFVDAPTFSDILLFFKNELGFFLPMRLHYLLMHLTKFISYPRFTKVIVDHFMVANLEIPKRLHEHCHRYANDEIVKSIFNSGKNKEGDGMQILYWMLTEEMKLTRHYQMYVSVFGVDVPTTQSQPIKSTQEMHRTLSAPMSPNPVATQGESSAPRKPTVIGFRVRNQLDPEMPIPIAAKIDIDSLDEEA
nr:hypothetical protein [Tanacetum cinerariifolium]